MSLRSAAEAVGGEAVAVDLAGAEGCSLSRKNAKLNKWLDSGAGQKSTNDSMINDNAGDQQTPRLGPFQHIWA